MMTPSVRALSLSALLIVPSLLHAADIATLEHSGGMGSVAIDDQARATIYDGIGFPFATVPAVFSGLDAGATLQYVADASVGSQFAAFVAALTNGVDDEIGLSVACCDGAFTSDQNPESIWFANTPGRTGPDLAGFTIDSVMVTITDISWSGGLLQYRTIYTIQGTGAVDSDADGVADSLDNCTAAANADQRDTDDDGIGNVCDPDFDQSCIVNFSDLGILKAFFFLPGDFDTDLNGDGQTNFVDLGLTKSRFFQAPGPSGVPNSCATH